MGDVDPDTLAEAARRYTDLRRRFWRFFLGGFALLAVLCIPLFAFGENLDPAVKFVLGMLLTIGFLTCWTGSLITWLSLLSFRCPRCGKRFLLSWASSWPTSNCKHCSLHLG